MYKAEIASEVEKLRKVKGAGDYSLDAFDQNDVRDTMNALNSRYPHIYDSSEIRFTGLADVNILS